MTDWGTFVGVTAVVLLALLSLARASSDAAGDLAASDPESSPEEVGPRWAFERKYFDALDARREASMADDPVDGAALDGDDAVHSPPSRDGLQDEPAPERGDSSTAGTAPTEPRSGVAAQPGPRASAGESGADQPSGLEGSDVSPGSPDGGLSTVALLANVALSQGLFGVVLIGAALYTAIPIGALGVDLASDLSTGLPALAVGVLLGVGLYLASTLGAAGGASFGLDHDETLRDVLTPDSAAGWVLLLGVVLPVIAGFEELLFRAALVGVPAAGFDVPVALLVVGSSVAFALGHGAQGRLGILVTGLLGLVLAGAFVVTDSLLVVVVAHYLVNALEFVLGGYLGVGYGD